MAKDLPKDSITLSIIERILLLNLIPHEGNMVELMMFKDIEEKLDISSKEAEKIGLKSIEKWWVIRDDKKAESKSVEFSSSEKEFLKWVLTKLDTEKKLTEQHITIYNMFVK